MSKTVRGLGRRPTPVRIHDSDGGLIRVRAMRYVLMILLVVVTRTQSMRLDLATSSFNSP
jgi:hypothetical protein